MMPRVRSILSPLLTLGAAALIWLMWTEIDLLRGTILWDLRFLAFGVAAIAVLTLAERIARRFNAR